MSQQEFNKELVRRWFAAFPDLDDAAFETFVHPDIVNHPAPPSLKNGLENFKKVLMYVNAAVPDQTSMRGTGRRGLARGGADTLDGNL